MSDRPDLVSRLRGIYSIPVNDGAGPLNGSDTFTREFPVAPIQKEAADEIERLRAALLSIIERHDREDTGEGFTRGGGLAWAMAQDARDALGNS